MADDKHLKIDLDFLDKEDTAAKEVARKKAEQKSTVVAAPASNINWKKTLLWGGGILFGLWIIIAAASGDSSTPSATSNATNAAANSSQVATGQYMCSQSDHDYADSIDQDPNNTRKQYLSQQETALQNRSDALDAEKARIQAESSSVDQTDQSAIDSYNADVNNYNAELQQYNVDQQSLSSQIDAYNAGEQAYNSYLQQHCTPQ